MLKDAGFKVKVSDKDGVLTKAELLKELKKFKPDALACLLTDKIDAEVFDSAAIKICATYSVGFNHIDLNAAKERGIIVTHTPGVLTDAVAEFTVSLIFALTKHIVAADKFTRAGKYKGWEPQLFIGEQLKGKILGVLGAGRIGSRVAQIFHSLGLKILYSDLAPNMSLDNMGAIFEDKKTLLKRSDIVTVHVPLFDSTHHFISNKEFDLMKNSAFLINTSRGPVVDELALVDALVNGKIAGVALDVFENEPKFEKELAKMSNVILTPHIASATKEARDKMSEMLAQSIISFAKGEKPEHVVQI
jgi:glyoxylate reductase